VVKLPNVNKDSFELLGPNYFASDEVVYYVNDWSEAIETEIDLNSFEGFVEPNHPNPDERLELGHYAKDNQYVYYAGHALPELDLETFNYVGMGFWGDKNNEQYGWSEIQKMLVE